MIKQAEINAAYQQGVHAAMVKLATGEAPKDYNPMAYAPDAASKTDVTEKLLKGRVPGAYGDAETMPGMQGIYNELERQNQIRQLIGLGGEGLVDRYSGDYASTPDSKNLRAWYNPMNLATMANLSRAGMLGGAAGGAYLGGMDPRAAAIATGGALGGGMVGGNIGRALGAGIDAFRGGDSALQRQAIQAGGALGGLGGGLAAGHYLG